MKKTRLLLSMNLATAMICPCLALAETPQPTKLEQIEVIGVAEQSPQQQSVDSADLLQNGNSETGALLRQLNGVSASRKGGHGLDPQIRGQQYSQLNILLDGAKIEGGCPNRMDPPTSYSEIASYDEIEVIRGVKSVLYGAGGSGGTLLFKRTKPEYNPEKPISGEISLGKSNVMNYEANAQLNAVGETGYLVVQGARKDANNYTDGNGDVVKSSYQTQQGHLDLGWTPNQHHHLKFSAEKSQTDDALYPGAAMDAPQTEGSLLRLQYEGRQLSEAVSDLDIDIYQSKVDHVMNNYELRTPPSATMLRETPTSTETQGAKLKLTSDLGKTQLDYGVQYESINKQATLWNRYASPNTELNYMWPDVTNRTQSVFAETNTALNAQRNLIVGLRYDQVDVTADRVFDAPSGAAANQPSLVYAKAYDDYQNEDSASEGNLNGVIRLENTLNQGYRWYVGASHTKRSADATERFMSKWGMNMTTMTQTAWIGNPNLKPEQHNQLDLGMGKTGKLSWNAAVWYDQVNDYILRDLAVNQYANGIKTTANGQTEVYVNVDAELYGADLDASYQLSPRLKTGGQFSITQGKNTTDNRNIALISAPNGSAFIDYSGERWQLGSRLNFALEETDIDEQYTPSSSHGKTPAWSTLDLYGGYQVNKSWQIQAGIDNLFDHAYYDHLSYDPVSTAVFKNNEPGRNFWAKVTAHF